MMTKTVKEGMLCWIYKRDADSTKPKDVILTGPKVAPVFEVCDRYRHLEHRMVQNKQMAVPFGIEDESLLCFTEAFIYSSDSRFPNRYPIPVFDALPGARKEEVKPEGPVVAFVFRPIDGTDCSNRGITAISDQVVLEGPQFVKRDQKHFELARLVVKERVVFGRQYLYATPFNEKDPDNIASTGYMMGGNFIYSDDPRFPSNYPIPVHDRREW